MRRERKGRRNHWWDGHELHIISDEVRERQFQQHNNGRIRKRCWRSIVRQSRLLKKLPGKRRGWHRLSLWWNLRWRIIEPIGQTLRRGYPATQFCYHCDTLKTTVDFVRKDCGPDDLKGLPCRDCIEKHRDDQFLATIARRRKA